LKCEQSTQDHQLVDVENYVPVQFAKALKTGHGLMPTENCIAHDAVYLIILALTLDPFSKS